ncbi:2-keto-4-pentenoate hydratase [Nocardia australiensis]|uniref:2-keto-4-pentenoate hydratase n=1 Tax=Nocardia australiensis TaxID=2887191 RepID=UPI0035590C78
MPFDDMAVADGAMVDLGRLLQPKVEAEVAFVLRADLSGPGLDEEAVRAATDHVVAALEIVDSRIAGWDITFVDTVSDNASSGLYVLGQAPVLLDDLDLAEVGMKLVDGNGAVVSQGSGADCLGDPVTAVLWLARTCQDFGAPLRAGEVVLSGALGPMVPAVSGGIYTASLDGLGTVSVGFCGPDVPAMSDPSTAFTVRRIDEMTTKVAIVGSGNIGSDLMMKIIRPGCSRPWDPDQDPRPREPVAVRS